MMCSCLHDLRRSSFRDYLIDEFIIIGYRDAQCGWFLVNEASSKDKPLPEGDPLAPKTAQCLCIYAARRGILEV